MFYLFLSALGAWVCGAGGVLGVRGPTARSRVYLLVGLPLVQLKM